MRQQGASAGVQSLMVQALEIRVTEAPFLIHAIYNILPSPSILFCWGKVDNVLPSPSILFCWGKVWSPACPLCLKRGTLSRADKIYIWEELCTLWYKHEIWCVCSPGVSDQIYPIGHLEIQDGYQIGLPKLLSFIEMCVFGWFEWYWCKFLCFQACWIRFSWFYVAPDRFNSRAILAYHR